MSSFQGCPPLRGVPLYSHFAGNIAVMCVPYLLPSPLAWDQDEDGFRDGDDENYEAWLQGQEMVRPPDQLELTEQVGEGAGPVLMVGGATHMSIDFFS